MVQQAKCWEESGIPRSNATQCLRCLVSVPQLPSRHKDGTGILRAWKPERTCHEESPANTSLHAQAGDVWFWQGLRIPIGDLTHHLQPSEEPKSLAGLLHQMRCSLWPLQQAFVKKREKWISFPNRDHFCEKNWIQVTRRHRLFEGLSQRTRDEQYNKSLKQKEMGILLSYLWPTHFLWAWFYLWLLLSKANMASRGSTSSLAQSSKALRWYSVCLNSDTQMLVEVMAAKNLVFGLLATNSTWHIWCQILAVCLSNTEQKDTLKFLIVIWDLYGNIQANPSPTTSYKNKGLPIIYQALLKQWKNLSSSSWWRRMVDNAESEEHCIQHC